MLFAVIGVVLFSLFVLLRPKRQVPTIGINVVKL